jgi:hypothetical protein
LQGAAFEGPLFPDSEGCVADSMFRGGTRLRDLDDGHGEIDECVSPSLSTSCQFDYLKSLKGSDNAGCGTEGGHYFAGF